jgi:hypothetical protein
MWFLDRCSWCLDYPDARGGNGRCVCVCVFVCRSYVRVCVPHTRTHTTSTYTSTLLHIYGVCLRWKEESEGTLLARKIHRQGACPC